MAVSLVATVALVCLLAGRWDELGTGVTGAPLVTVVAAVALQLVALVARSEAWHVCVRASGGRMSRRVLYRASSAGFVGGLLHTQLGTAARIATLRRSAPEASPRVPALIGAELPILIVEGGLAALTSFTLVGPLGLPWWVPLVCLVAVAGVTAALRAVGAAGAHWLRSGLAVMRSLDGRARLAGFVLIAVFAQVGRTWLLLLAVGADASVFDAIAVLIAVCGLGQLPFGLSVGAAASVLILGPQGVAWPRQPACCSPPPAPWAGLRSPPGARSTSPCTRPRVKGATRAASSMLARLAPPQSHSTAPGVLAAQVLRSAERACFDIFGPLRLAPGGAADGLGTARMATAKLLLATGIELEVDASLEEVVKLLENAERSSAGTLARLTEAQTGAPVALNPAHVVTRARGRPLAERDLALDHDLAVEPLHRDHRAGRQALAAGQATRLDRLAHAELDLALGGDARAASGTCAWTG